MTSLGTKHILGPLVFRCRQGKGKGSTFLTSYVQESLGPCTYDIRLILGFWTPFPLSSAL